MVPWPTFLSFPFSLPALPSISLPANIQRRFLSYVLKRALGRFIRSGLDVDKIQSQIGEGRVEIEGLEVDEDEINGLIPPSLPVRLRSAVLDNVTARIPFPNLWSAPLTLSLDTLTLDFDLVTPAAVSPKGKSPETPFRHAAQSRRSPTSPSVDLAASVTTAADEFLHEELDAYEEAELDRSIRQSLILSRSDPFVKADVPGAFPSPSSPNEDGEPLPATVESTTVLAGLVERILTRLECTVNNVRVRLHQKRKEEDRILELRVGRIAYADESGSQTSTAESATSTTRVIRVSDIGIYLIPVTHPTARPSYSSTSRSSSVSSASSSTSTAGDDHAEMYMSQAVADLRQSMVAEIDSDASVYHSAIGEDLAPAPGDLPSGKTPQTDDHGRTPTPTASHIRPEANTQILTFGSEDLILRLKTTRPNTVAGSAAAGRPSNSSLNTSPALSIEVNVGTVAILLLPVHMSALLQITRLLAHSETSEPSPKPESLESSQPKIDAKLRVKGVVVTTVYDMAAASSNAYLSSVGNYWARPSTFYVPVGNLKLKLDSIEVGYSAAGATGQVSKDKAPGRQPVRRASKVHTSQSGPKPAVLTLRLQDASIFEYIATDTTPASATHMVDTIPGGAYPVLMFDAGLPKQYETEQYGQGGRHAYGPARNMFPEFDQLDWRNSGLQKKSGGGERLWKVRPKAKGAMKARTIEDDSLSVLNVTKELSQYSAAGVTLQPIHVFLDLSLVERLLPVLRFISPSILATRPDKDATPHPSPARSHHQLPPQYVLDDLDAQASSIATLQPSSGSQDLLIVRCPLVRLDIRCPAPVNRRGSWGDGAHLRSGIVTLDVHALQATAKRPPGPGNNGRVSFSRGTAEPKAAVTWSKMILFFARVPEKRASAVLVVGPLQPDPNDKNVLLPMVEVRSATNPSNSIKTSTITVRIPSVQAKVRQRTIEGLQFFADDITHWLDGAFGDGSAPKPRDDLKMIGSRFFGSKASSSASSSAEEDDEEDMPAATVLRLFITETSIDLHVPRHEQPDERVLSLKASDADVKIESNTTGRQETALTLVVLDAEFVDGGDSTFSTRILGRTTPLSLVANNSPIIHLRFTSLTQPQTEFKETGIKLAVASCTASITHDLSWAKDLARFAKTPEGVFEDVVPSEVTRIGVSLYDVAVHVKPPLHDGSMVFVVASLEAKTDLESGAESRALELGLGNLAVLAVDDTKVATALHAGQGSSADAFKRAGFAQLAEVIALELQVMQDKSGDDELLVDVLQAQIRVTACADSLATVGGLAAGIATMWTLPRSPSANASPNRSPAALEHSVNVFASIDEHAFNQIPDIAAGADLVVDDLPTNLDYLDTTTRPRQQSSTDHSTGESLRSWQATSEDGHHEGGDTIKVLQTEFEVVDDYWETLPTTTPGLTDETRLGKTRVRVHDASVAVYLHEGYDWIKTRKTIEEEIKAVRRRLERIRQLLASGHKADESLDGGNTGSMLFNSVYIGLDQEREGLDDTAALLAAIDEELEELAGAPVPSGGAPAERPRRTRLHGRRLTRSKRAQIEVNLMGIKCDVDSYGPEDNIASRVHATVQSLEILDHIKTSTWKKFLTEMKADARGNMRETDADMVRVELLAVRPSLPSLAEESRLKAKILPLRLHVDQDALDFLKRFFNFSIPIPPEVMSSTPSKKPASTQPFFQHVEIYPIELKLDYKPKRVDFAALREGKTMELMNFFHFDGAEMTLRHITLSGIAGWDRVSTTLQDTWTPDVKANQIADIVSGVSPIRSLVNVGSGVADLILLPIEQYRKDGRVARGVQKGTNSFVKSTAMEMMKLGARLATGTQVVLEKAEGVFGGKVEAAVLPPALSDDEVEIDAEVLSRYANQPASTREGLQEGYKAMSRNINSAAQTILAVPMEVYERSGDDGPLRAVVRAVPIAVLKPMIGASEAVSKTLLGMRNSLDPQGRKELVDKYK